MNGLPLKKVLEKTIKMLQNSDSPHLDAELLLVKILEKPREYILAHPETALTKNQEDAWISLVKRRRKGEPMAHILGHKEFWSLDLSVSGDVLVPRPETEHLVEWLLQHLPADKIMRIADLGVGAGGIALALAHERPHWRIDAVDFSAKALGLARQNAIQHQISNVLFYWGSWCEALPIRGYHAIVSNPPYISTQDSHLSELIRYEPREALDGGTDGLDAIKIIVHQAQQYLLPGGSLIIEHGFDQKAAVFDLMTENDYQNVESHVDLAGLPRYTTARFISQSLR
jgi:release factor glutamine methyltransferase